MGMCFMTCRFSIIIMVRWVDADRHTPRCPEDLDIDIAVKLLDDDLRSQITERREMYG